MTYIWYKQRLNISCIRHWNRCSVDLVVDVLLYVHRKRRLIRDGSPGRSEREKVPPAGTNPRTYHIIDRLEERGVERGSARRFSLK